MNLVMILFLANGSLANERLTRDSSKCGMSFKLVETTFYWLLMDSSKHSHSNNIPFNISVDCS